MEVEEERVEQESKEEIDLEKGAILEGEVGEKQRRLAQQASRYVLGFALNLKCCSTMEYHELLELLEFQNWTHTLSVSSNDPMYPRSMDKFYFN